MMPDWPVLFGTEPIQWVQELFGLGHPLPFRIFSLLGDTWGVLLAVGVALWLFGRRAAYPVIGIVVVGAATKLLLSEIFHQTRPEGPGIVVYEHLDVSSFPSGHVYATVGPWGLLYALGFVPFWVPALATALVGLGRIYLGTHYLGDVLGGIILGVLLVWLYARLLPRLGGWFARRGARFYTALSLTVIGGTLAWMLTAGAHPRRYEIFGMLIAAAVGLPLQARLLPDPGAPAGAGKAAWRVVLGTLGLAAILLWNRTQGGGALWFSALTAGLAALWVLVGAPAALEMLAGGRRAGAERVHPPYAGGA